MSLQGIKNIVLLIFKCVLSVPYRGYGWADRSQKKSDEIVVISFTKEESLRILQKSKQLKTSVNCFAIWAISQSCMHLVQRFKWLMPVWLPKDDTIISDASIRNHSSFVEINLKLGQTLIKFNNKYLDVLQSNEPWFWAKSFDLLNVLLKYPFKILVWLSNLGFQRTGTISNLGVFSGSFITPIMFVPPVFKNSPVSFGILTYNDQITIAVQSKPDTGPHSEELKNILNKLKLIILSE